MLESYKKRFKEFQEWQHRPYVVAPMSQEEHDCCTCHTHFTGNYCPRCGQSSKISRYSFKNAMLLFLDVWGLGNRGFFRTIRDLMLRPGYMIRDYLSGMQMAYFPPFKMLFLLTAFSVLVAHGLNIEGQSYEERTNEARASIEDLNKDNKEGLETALKAFNWVVKATERFPNIVTLFSIVFLTAVLYLWFRHSKNIPDLRFSEFLITMVYSACMTTIYETLLTFFGTRNELISLASLLYVIPLKQLSGYTWKRTIFSVFLTFVLLFIALILLVIAVCAVLVLLGIVPVPETE